MKLTSRATVTAVVMSAVFGLATHSWAATIVAASCSLSDVQAAVNSAVDGDKVLIPDGSCAWAGGISTTKQIRIEAQNYTPTSRGTMTRNVTITNNSTSAPLLSFTSGNSFHVGVAGIRFNEGSGNQNHLRLRGSGSKVPLVNDCAFEVKNRFGNQPDIAIIAWLSLGGVMWNSYVNGVGGGSGGQCCPEGPSIIVNSPRSWVTASTMGTLDTQGTQNVYFENNTFVNFGQSPDVDDQGRLVIRYSLLDGVSGLTHGFTSAWGGRHVEYYNNTITTSTNNRNVAGRYFWLRAGTGIWTDNNISYQNRGYGTPRLLDTSDNTTPTSYPQPRQCGWGHDGTSHVPDPVYLWNNTGGSTWQVSQSAWTANCRANVEVFVDAGPKPGYAKYTYPHPLTAGLTPPPAQPSLSISDVTVAEGATASFTLSLSAASPQTVTVLASTADGTATAGTDYTARTGVSITFPPGSTAQTFSVTTLADSLSEGNETFVVNLTSAANATVSDAQGMGTITNVAGPPPLPALSVNNVTATEGETANFTVSLSASSTQTVSVIASTANGTATGGSDYTARTGVSITFPPGSTAQTFSVTTLADSLSEGNETFLLNLTTAANATISDSQGVGTILDAGPALPPSITNHPVNQVLRAGQSAAFSVTATGTGPLSYQWKKNGTAIAGATASAYTTPPLNFADNASAYSVTVSNSLGAITSNSAAVFVSTPLGPVASYNFDEGTGTTLTDRSGNGHHGSITNAVWNTTGKSGGSLTFNGANAWVTVPDADPLDLTAAMTLEAWVFPTAPLITWPTIVLKEQAGNLAYALYANSNVSAPSGYVFIGQEHGVVGSVQLPQNTWTHLAATYDGSMLRFYVNGTLTNSAPRSGNIVTSGGALRLGGNSVWGEYFTGRVDDVRIYDRALSPSEIQNDMNTPVTSPVGSCS